MGCLFRGFYVRYNMSGEVGREVISNYAMSHKASNIKSSGVDKNNCLRRTILLCFDDFNIFSSVLLAF